MRSTRTLVMIGVALAAGLIAALLAVRWVDSQVRSRTATSIANASKLVVAVEDLRVGREITAASVRIVDWPSDAIPPGASSKIEDVVGRTVRTPILKGEPLLAARLTQLGARGGLAAVLEPGKRAISVGINDVVGIAGESLDGSYVDVIVNSTEGADAERQRSISKIVLERVRVLAVSQTPGAQGRVNAVTLEVSPQEAEKLDLARSVGSLSLMLRAPGEEGGSQARGATKDALFSGTPRAAVQPATNPAPARPASSGRSPTPVAAPAAAAAPVAPVVPKTCVDALVGSERRSECF